MGNRPFRPRSFAPNVSSLVFWHFGKKVAPWVFATVLYLGLATTAVRWDMGRNHEPVLDFGAQLYGITTQLFFEPTQSLPESSFSRLVFWLTPVFGALLLVRGLIRVGATLFDAEERRRLWVKIMSDRMDEHIVVCGLGHVGVRVVESLKDLGERVVAIERREIESFGAQVAAMGIPVLYGDARRDELLIEAGIRKAKAVVCATDDDLTNLEVAIDSKRENPDIRVVMRMFDQRVAGKIGTALELEETFSTSSLAGPLVAFQATGPGVRGVYRLEDGSLRVDLELPAPRGWSGRSVADCEDEIDGRVVGIRRGQGTGGGYLRPRHDTRLEEGDLLTLDIPSDRLERLR